jgi:hydroxymethylpyrimidine pyrophosphatase-like HAD family hydrolase
MRLILCDIDGCLGSEDTAPLDLQSLAMIAAWNRTAQHELASSPQSARPILTLCSGRPQPYAEAICRMLANTRVPIVCEMGVWLYDPRDNSYTIDPSITASHLSAIHECQSWIRKDLAPQGIVMQPGKVASISLWHKHTPTLLSFFDMLALRVEQEAWGLRVSRTVSWINLDLAHVSKGTGIDRLLATLASEGTPVSKANLFGIGDTMTDIAIRDRVHWFAAPSNADPLLKARSDFVSQHEHAQGVVEALHAIEQTMTRSV